MENRKKRLQRIKNKITQLEGNIPTKKGRQNTGSLLELVSGNKQMMMSSNGMKSQRSTKSKKNGSVRSVRDYDRFYRQAVEKNKIDAIMEEETTKGYKKLSNMKKMSENSVSLLSERLDTNIAIAILNSDEKLSKTLSFEQVGKILSDLQIFNIIVFGEDFECNLNSRGTCFKR